MVQQPTLIEFDLDFMDLRGKILNLLVRGLRPVLWSVQVRLSVRTWF